MINVLEGILGIYNTFFSNIRKYVLLTTTTKTVAL
jgi:hypothetical protein